MSEDERIIDLFKRSKQSMQDDYFNILIKFHNFSLSEQREYFNIYETISSDEDLNKEIRDFFYSEICKSFIKLKNKENYGELVHILQWLSHRAYPISSIIIDFAVALRKSANINDFTEIIEILNHLCLLYHALEESDPTLNFLLQPFIIELHAILSVSIINRFNDSIDLFELLKIRFQVPFYNEYHSELEIYYSHMFEDLCNKLIKSKNFYKCMDIMIKYKESTKSEVKISQNLYEYYACEAMDEIRKNINPNIIELSKIDLKNEREVCNLFVYDNKTFFVFVIFHSDNSCINNVIKCIVLLKDYFFTEKALESEYSEKKNNESLIVCISFPGNVKQDVKKIQELVSFISFSDRDNQKKKY